MDGGNRAERVVIHCKAAAVEMNLDRSHAELRSAYHISGGGREVFLDHRDEHLLRHVSDDAVDGFTVLEKDETRDSGHVVARCEVLVLVCVDLGDLEPALIRSRE